MKKLKVLVSLITDDNDYQLQQAAVAQHTAHHLDIAVEIIYAGNDGVNQSLQLLQAIQSSAESRPDAVVVEPVGTGMPQVAQAAAGAKIGWVVLNRSVDYVSRLRSPYFRSNLCACHRRRRDWASSRKAI
jgi:ABC-type sugar transport system substrate-binding protein